MTAGAPEGVCGAPSLSCGGPNSTAMSIGATTRGLRWSGRDNGARTLYQSGVSDQRKRRLVYLLEKKTDATEFGLTASGSRATFDPSF